MTWQDDWKRLAAKIDGVTAAAIDFLSPGADDELGVANDYFVPLISDTFAEIQQFVTQYEQALPLNAVRRFHSIKKPPLGQRGIKGLPGQVAVLAGIRTELEHLFGDRETRMISLTERAFVHLQRLIIVDESGTGEKWKSAFEKRETDCERLGGVHLLLHGIWGFKADAGSGGRTDLVLSTMLTESDLNTVRRVSEGFVLTEWKLVKDRKKAAKKAQEAFIQAERYASGALAGFELRSIRYLVLVSDDYLELPDDKVGTRSTYRHINIAVKPSKPSKKVPKSNPQRSSLRARPARRAKP